MNFSRGTNDAVYSLVYKSCRSKKDIFNIVSNSKAFHLLSLSSGESYGYTNLKAGIWKVEDMNSLTHRARSKRYGYIWELGKSDDNAISIGKPAPYPVYELV